MSVNIGAVNWFTKKQYDFSYPEQSEKLVDSLSKDIIQIFNESDHLNKAASKIFQLFQKSDLKNVCSESRLPVCSLFHHLKNTSGIAVCLMMQKLDIDPNYISRCLADYNMGVQYHEKDFKGLIRLASLMHDIGKLRSYTSSSKDQPYHYHTTQTKEIIEQILENSNSQMVEKYELKKILPQLAANHHSWAKNRTQLESLIGSADTVASATDRTYDIEARLVDGIVTVKSNDKIFPHQLDFNTTDIRCLDSPSSEILAIDQVTSKSVEIISGEKSVQLFNDSVVNGGTIHYTGFSKPLSGNIGLISLDTIGIQGFINEAEKLPMLRGGSAIVDQVLSRAKEIISDKVCEEAVLFAGGGNLLSFIPDNKMFQENLQKEIETQTSQLSNKGLTAAVVTFDRNLDMIKKDFGSLLDYSQKQLDIRKNKTEYKVNISNNNKICGYCFKRPVPDSSNKCSVCLIKEENGKVEKWKNRFIKNTYGLNSPIELTNIGDSIAVLAIDGNMMGRLFKQTMTPAEYTFKSETFTSEFESIIEKTIDEFISNRDTRDNFIKHTQQDGEYLGIDVLYVGGDDALIIMNAKGAISFAEMLINRVSDEFNLKLKFDNGTTFENPIVTLSCGIAIADNHFPIYFLLEAARNMESKAKAAFRLATYTDENNFIKIPKGAIAVTAISSAMPTSDFSQFVISSDNETSVSDLAKFNKLLLMAMKNDKKPLITDILTCGIEKIDRLNLLKSMYSSVQRKKDMDLDDCEILADVLLNIDLMNALKMVVPHVWAQKSGGE